MGRGESKSDDEKKHREMSILFTNFHNLHQLIFGIFQNSSSIECARKEEEKGSLNFEHSEKCSSNLEIIKRGQFRFDKTPTTYDLKMNCAGDLSFEEFVSQYLGQGALAGDGPDAFIDPNIDPEIFTQRIVRSRRRDYQSFPTELDWEKRGKIVP